ncbi:sulfite exporter TauE/SafE family protein [Ruegeria sp.]|uniref:sulfite exporter TauE/SafE family protein n=1 Tax=Ruegeria sp. TaxID=1879320 RepID=UPI00230F8810|nr:sulfite exporter TauE/SafE family protein [Ruegeria sp.]MDA7963461.1 sulfite exporter TauE/SafE family protein [Ruegeria sp.]
MNSPDYLLILAGAAAGGFINGLAGFGTSLFALGFFLSVLPPTQSVALVLILSVVTGLQGLWVVRNAILDNPKRLARFLLPALVGIPLGVLSLRYVDVQALKLVIAGFLLIYGGFFTVRRNLPKIDRPTPAVDVTVGFLGGVLGGLASLSGALPTMWCSMRAWPKAETRAVLQPFNVCVLALSAALLALRGAYTPETLRYALIAIPTALASAQFGIILFKRVSDTLFRRLLIVLCFVSGLILMGRELF